LRIAQVSPLFEAVPPRLYGGTERIISNLTEALVARGHDVTLFASGDAETSARLVAVRERALRLDPAPLKSPIAAHLSMLDEVRRRADNFDIIHFHLSHFQHFPLFERMPERTVTTPHGRLDYVDLPEASRRWPGFPMISISMRQRRPLPMANWVANIQHGLPLELYRPLDDFDRDGEAPYLAFLGRLSRAKRPDRAIEIARKSGMKLKIAAKIDENDPAYFRNTIEPLIDGEQIEYVGEINEAEKPAFLGKATAMVFPIDWPEPFGLVVIEAMAFGTPVIAWNEGAMPEIVDEGVTGFVVGSIDEAVARAREIDDLDRRAVRSTFERRFSLERMVNEYEAAYARLVIAAASATDRPSYGQRRAPAA
jgi:glycosyltransferase involved in cell wall biosynthesis